MKKVYILGDKITPGKAKKHGERWLSMQYSRFGRVHPIYDLHDMAGGSPLDIITAPNVHRTS